MKLYLAIIFSVSLLLSSTQESFSQVSSMIFSSIDSCCVANSTKNQDNACDDTSDQSDTCCEGTSCDCTCCVHISLFNTSFDLLTFMDESEKDNHSYIDNHGHLIPFPIFHPPLV